MRSTSLPFFLSLFCSASAHPMLSGVIPSPDSESASASPQGSSSVRVVSQPPTHSPYLVQSSMSTSPSVNGRVLRAAISTSPKIGKLLVDHGNMGDLELLVPSPQQVARRLPRGLFILNDGSDSTALPAFVKPSQTNPKRSHRLDLRIET